MKLFVPYHLLYSYKIGDQKYIESEFKSMILDDKDEPWEQEALEQLEMRN